MSVEYDDIREMHREMWEHLKQIELRQNLANSRIRQDIAAVMSALILIVAAGVIVHEKWPSWLLLILLFAGQPALQAYLAHGARKQEEHWPQSERSRRKLAASLIEWKERNQRQAAKREAQIDAFREKLKEKQKRERARLGVSEPS